MVASEAFKIKSKFFLQRVDQIMFAYGHPLGKLYYRAVPENESVMQKTMEDALEEYNLSSTGK